jgi:hypothetical protein
MCRVVAGNSAMALDSRLGFLRSAALLRFCTVYCVMFARSMSDGRYFVRDDSCLCRKRCDGIREYVFSEEPRYLNFVLCAVWCSPDVEWQVFRYMVRDDTFLVKLRVNCILYFVQCDICSKLDEVRLVIRMGN